MRFLVTLILPLSCLSMPCNASAQQLASIAVRWDNDILALRGNGAPPDYDYTQGLQLMAGFRGGFGVLPRGLEPHGDSTTRRSHATLRLGVGQRIYTPRQDAAEPVPGERPYAGWLYIVADVIALRGRTEHRVAVELGITGPAALGEQVQNGIHSIVGATPQLGWDHQLHTEPAAHPLRNGVAAQLRWSAAAPARRGRCRHAVDRCSRWCGHWCRHAAGCTWTVR